MASSRHAAAAWRCFQVGLSRCPHAQASRAMHDDMQAAMSQPRASSSMLSALMPSMPRGAAAASSQAQLLQRAASAGALPTAYGLLPAAAAAALQARPPPPPPAVGPSSIAAASISGGGPATSGPGSGSGVGGAGSGEDGGEDESLPHLLGGTRATQDDADAAERLAQAVLEDPLSMLMASRGMPLGMAVRGSGGTPIDDPDIAPSELQYQMEALDDLFEAARLRATKLPSSVAQGPEAEPGLQAARARHGAEGDAALGSVDSWGTTRAGADEIAARLVRSNRELERMAAEAESEVAGSRPADDAGDLELDFQAEAPGEAKYRTLEQMSKDIKGLDQVFEVLASVPWLDEDDLAQKELKGVAMVGLLGTLEEVGFSIRGQVERIWAGERDHSLITECSEAKDQAALISILFHAKKMEEEYGEPKPVLVKRA